MRDRMYLSVSFEDSSSPHRNSFSSLSLWLADICVSRTKGSLSSSSWLCVYLSSALSADLPPHRKDFAPYLEAKVLLDKGQKEEPQ